MIEAARDERGVVDRVVAVDERRVDGHRRSLDDVTLRTQPPRKGREGRKGGARLSANGRWVRTRACGAACAEHLRAC
eukprot:5037830-Prymnesium_polylepis.1